MMVGSAIMGFAKRMSLGGRVLASGGSKKRKKEGAGWGKDALARSSLFFSILLYSSLFFSMGRKSLILANFF